MTQNKMADRQLVKIKENLAAKDANVSLGSW